MFGHFPQDDLISCLNRKHKTHAGRTTWGGLNYAWTPSYFLHFLCFLEPDRDRDFLECFLDLDFLWHRLRTFFRDTDLPWDRSLLRSFTPMHFLAARRAEPSPFLNRYGLPAAISFRIAADFLDRDLDDFAMEPSGEVIHAMPTIVCLLKRVAVV